MNQVTSNGSSAAEERTNAAPIFMPPADIFETGDSILMLLDIPGAEPGSLEVTLDKRVMTITARASSSSPEGYMPAHVEFRDGTYERRFVFSEQMDDEHIDARLKDGVLRLTVPKAPDAGARKIKVKAE